MNGNDCSNKILFTKTGSRLDLAHGLLLPPLVACKLEDSSSHIVLILELVAVPSHNPLHYISTHCLLFANRDNTILCMCFWDKKTNLGLLGKTSWNFMKTVTFEA